MKCPECRLEFADPLRGGSAAYYQSVNANRSAKFQPATLHPGFQYLVRELKKITRRYLNSRQRRVVDVGCGTGYLLAELQQVGFEVFGLDFDPTAIQVANEYYHVPAKVGTIHDLQTLTARFDLALLTHVLEHVPDPHRLLTDLGNIVAPQGILFLDVPNRERFTLRRSLQKGELEMGEYPPHHLTFWSAPSLVYALHATGWTMLECHARPFNQENQVALFLNHQFPQLHGLNHFLARSFGAMGNMIRLQGETLTVVAQRT